MTGIKVLDTGIIYRNPKPHVHSIHAYFPSAVCMDNGEMLATLVLGEAFEAPNLRTHVARSTDNGETWQMEGTVYEGRTDPLTSDSGRVMALPGGELVLLMHRADRSVAPDDGFTGHENMGFVPMEMVLWRSHDYGHNWSGPEVIEPPLVGPAFEFCSAITPLSDGRWIIPTSTWRGWNGECPNGMKMIALVSSDQGKSWPEYWDVMVDPKDNVIYWETKIVEMPDGRLLCPAWAYDEAAAADLPNQYAVSNDGGKTWAAPMSTGLLGQTPTPFALPDGRILLVYRRMDETGLWANISHLDGDRWVNEQCAPLWGAGAQGLTTTSDNMAHNFNVLRFGAPCITSLADGTIFVAFWCYEDCVSNIRWYKLAIE